MYDLLQNAPPKGNINNYDPNYADEFNAHNYGGFSQGSNNRGGGGGRGGASSGR